MFSLDLLIVNSIPFQVFLKCVIPVARSNSSQINAAMLAIRLLPPSKLQKTSLLYQQLQESQYFWQSLVSILHL